MRERFRKNIRGISTVIATIIIVAITIVMAIAIAYWALGIGGAFTRFEKLEFTSGYATGTQAAGYTVYITVKNTGSAAATVDYSTVFYNGKPPTAYGAFAPTPSSETETLEPGDSKDLTITLPGGADTVWKSGMTVEVMIQTTAGKQYPKVVTLP